MNVITHRDGSAVVEVLYLGPLLQSRGVSVRRYSDWGWSVRVLSDGSRLFAGSADELERIAGVLGLGWLTRRAIATGIRAIEAVRAAEQAADFPPERNFGGRE